MPVAAFGDRLDLVHVYGDDMHDPAYREHEHERNMQYVPKREHSLVGIELSGLAGGVEVLL